jgi:hypothetical protein
MVHCLIGKQIISFGRESEKIHSDDFVIITNKVQYFIKERGRPARSFIKIETEKRYIPSYLESAFEILSKRDDEIIGTKLYCEGENHRQNIITYSARHHGQQHIFKGKSCFSMTVIPYSATKKYRIAKPFTLKDAKQLKQKTEDRDR